ncbi:MAG: choice-of-anchor Q domain-containing protein [Candidatus Krumholzibacteriia bacterium]
MKYRRHVCAVLVILAAAALTAAPVQAARLHVRVGGVRSAGPSAPGIWDLENCYATLAAAARSAAPLDSLLLFPEVHACEEEVVLPAFLGNRALDRERAATQVVLAASGRLVLAPSGRQAGVRGLTFTGGALRPEAALTVENSREETSLVVVSGCEFRGFKAEGTAQAGGGALRAIGAAGGLALEVEGCSFVDNAAEAPGGAVFGADALGIVFTDCLFENNQSTGGGGRGGGVAVRSTGYPVGVEFVDCVFAGNASSGPGGAISADNATVRLFRCRVEGSRSGVGATSDWSEGAGVMIQREIGGQGPASFTADECVFRDNVGDMLPGPAGGDGGAVLVKGSLDRIVQVKISRCHFLENYNAQGGGLYVGRFAYGQVRQCSFVGNRAWYQGGGAMKGGALPACHGELVIFDYCEFVDNEAGFKPDGAETGEYSRGGGLMVRNRPRALVRNCTFLDNRVSGIGYAVGDGFAHALEGRYWDVDNQCMLLNTVFWGEGNDLQVHSEGGGIVRASHLALAEGQFEAGGLQPDELKVLDRMPLTEDGLRLPAPGSPLIDGGIDLGLGVDLRGTTIPQGSAPDIGACERVTGTAVQLPSPASSGSVRTHPNPFNPRTSITVTIPRAGEYRVAIYDLRGRAVAELHEGWLDGDGRSWTWDGTDRERRQVPAGVYLVRLSGAAGSAHGKLMLVR